MGVRAEPKYTELGIKFLSICKEKYLCPSKCIILAYRRRDVLRSVGNPLLKHGLANLYLFFNWKSTFNNKLSTNKEKLSIIQLMEKFILSQMDIKHTADIHVEDFCKQHNIENSWLRRMAITALTNSPMLPNKKSELQQWHKETVEFFKKLKPHPKYKWKSFAISLKFTNKLTVNDETDLEGLKYSTIHKAKGEEFEAALVVIPPSNANKENLFGFIQDNEQQRVYYVGASRAKKLLGFGLPENLFDHVVKVLIEKSINYLIIEI